jgi:hypothetical protein
MKWKIPMLAVITIGLLASCKNKSSENTEVKDSLTATNTNEGMDPSISSIEVPIGIKTIFEERYPQAANVQWNYYRPVEPYYIDWEWRGWPQMDTMDYVTTYRWNDMDYISWYDDQGNWVATVNNVSDFGTLPQPVNDAISKQYNGYTITSVKKENDKNRTAYEIIIEKGTDHGKLLIDENGKILKKKITVGGETTKDKMNPKDSEQ